VTVCQQDRDDGWRRRPRRARAAFAWLLSLLLVAPLAAVDPAGAQQAQTVSMNFKRTELADIVDRLAPALGTRFLYDEKLSGRVTISLPRRVTPDEAWQLLHAALAMQRFGAFPMPGGGFKVVPLEASAGASVWSPERPSPTGEARLLTLIPLEETPAQDMLAVIQPLLDSTTVATVTAARNGLILETTERRLAGILGLVEELDTRSSRTLSLRTLRERDVAMAQQVVQARFPEDGAPAQRVDTWADVRTNTLIYRATPQQAEVVAEVLDEIERPLPASGEIVVLPVLYADPAELVDRLQTLAAGGEGPGNASEAEQAQLSRLAGRDLTVVADPPTASLLVRASPYVIDIVREVVALLDRRPRQIAIEVLVQEWLYETGTTLSFAGVTAIGGLNGDQVTIQSIPGSAFQTLPVPDALAVQITNLPSQIQLVADQSEVEAVTILQPHMVLISGEEQILFSGSNVPVPRAPTSPESVTSGSSLTQRTVIERYDIGVEVLLRATLGALDATRLEVTLNVENLRSSLAGDVAEVGPTFTVRGVETRVELLPGQALLIAGDTEQVRTTRRTGVPFLMDIPWLGALFSATSDQDRRARIVVAIQAVALPDPAALVGYAVRRRLAFDQARQRQHTLRLDAGGAFGVRVAREASRERALALAQRLESEAHPARVHAWESTGEPVFDVYLLDFDGYIEAADRAFALSQQQLAPEVVPLAIFDPSEWTAPPARAQ